jgi:hypothetical protein
MAPGNNLQEHTRVKKRSLSPMQNTGTNNREVIVIDSDDEESGRKEGIHKEEGIKREVVQIKQELGIKSEEGIKREGVAIKEERIKREIKREEGIAIKREVIEIKEESIKRVIKREIMSEEGIKREVAIKDEGIKREIVEIEDDEDEEYVTPLCMEEAVALIKKLQTQISIFYKFKFFLQYILRVYPPSLPYLFLFTSFFACMIQLFNT